MTIRLLRLCAFCLLVCAASLCAAAPIPAGPDAHTQREFEAARLKWMRRVTVDAYQQIGRKSPAWDKAALHLLDLYARYATGDRSTLGQFEQAAKPLRKSGCTDPLVLHAIAVALSYTTEVADAEPLYRRAIEGYKEIRYPRCRAWDAALRLAWLDSRWLVWVLPDKGKAKEGDQWIHVAIQWAAEGIAEEQFIEGSQRAAWDTFELRLVPPTCEQPLIDAVAAEPGADPWMLNMLRGTTAVADAWDARGTGWASELTQEARKGFHDNMAKAREYLTKAYGLHPEYPEAATAMVGVAMAQGAEGGDSPRLWFDRAVAAQLDWKPAYHAMMKSLLPRWRGSHEDMLAFGRECLATNRFDTIVLEQLYDAAWRIGEYDADSAVWQDPALYADLRAVFEGILAEPSRKDNWPTRRALYAAVAWRCGHYDDARRQFDALGDEEVWDAFDSQFGASLELAKGQVFAATGPLAARVNEAEKLYQEGKASEALPLFEQLLKDNQDEVAAPFLRDRVACLQTEAALAAGDWVSITPPPDLVGWQRTSGRWTAAEAGALEVESSGGVPILRSNLRAPSGFEMRGEIEFPPDAGDVSAGFVVGYHPGGEPYGTHVLLRRDGNDVTIFGDSPAAGKHRTVPLQDTNRLLLQVWDSSVTVFVNDALTFVTHPLQTGYSAGAGDQVGLEARSPGLVRFHNVQTRKLTERPPEPETTIQAAAPTTEKAYLWYEAETTLKGDQWSTSNYWSPSGGLFLYQTGEPDTCTAQIAVPLDDWAVWVRARDETAGLRQLTATVNGAPSYIMGGTDAGQWMWYEVGIVHESRVDLAVTDISAGPWDGWVDAILLTNDLSFVPPGVLPKPEGYTAYKAEEDPDKGGRAAWIWYPNQPEPGSNGFYRKTFELPDAPTNATLSIQAWGRYVAYINDLEVGNEVEIGKAGTYEVAQHLKRGTNTIDVQVTHYGFLPGLKVTLDAALPAGATRIVSDLTWRATTDAGAVWNPAASDEAAWRRPFARIGEREMVGH